MQKHQKLWDASENVWVFATLCGYVLIRQNKYAPLTGCEMNHGGICVLPFDYAQGPPSYAPLTGCKNTED
ncbi:hypothetical protein R80B4_00647 [Fibrobacteres bacterium R8-0-B4]